MADFTKGPWCYDGTTDWRRYHILSGQREEYDTDDVAVVYDGINEKGKKQALANARLIAAAPDMYAALIDIAKQRTSTEWSEEGDTEYAYDKIIKVARSAIAKAGGK